MKRFLLIVCIAAAACSEKEVKTSAKSARASHLQTIESEQPRSAPLQPPPMLTDEAPPPKSTINLAQSDAPPPPTPQDEAVRNALPFSPAIALDPVDGQKISIRATTPTLEIKGRVFYFSSEANKSAFAANPQSYLKGPFNIKM